VKPECGGGLLLLRHVTPLSRRHVVYFCSGAHKLAAESFRYALAQAVKLRTDKVDRSHGAVEHLRSIVKRFVETPSALPGGCPLMNTAIDADDGNAVLRGLVKKAFADWRTRLCVVIEGGSSVERSRLRRSPGALQTQ
jgi:hypothetical protein